MWIYPHFDGWVVQDGDKIHKKHAFKIYFRTFSEILDQLFFYLFRGEGVGGSDQELSQAAPYAHICYCNPTPKLPPTPITANQHH